MRVEEWVDVSEEADDVATSQEITAFTWRATDTEDERFREEPYTVTGDLLVEQEGGAQVVEYQDVKRAVYLALKDFAETGQDDVFDAVFRDEVRDHKRGNEVDVMR